MGVCLPLLVLRFHSRYVLLVGALAEGSRVTADASSLYWPERLRAEQSERQRGSAPQLSRCLRCYCWIRTRVSNTQVPAFFTCPFVRRRTAIQAGPAVSCGRAVNDLVRQKAAQRMREPQCLRLLLAGNAARLARLEGQGSRSPYR